MQIRKESEGGQNVLTGIFLVRGSPQMIIVAF